MAKFKEVSSALKKKLFPNAGVAYLLPLPTTDSEGSKITQLFHELSLQALAYFYRTLDFELPLQAELSLEQSTYKW